MARVEAKRTGAQAPVRFLSLDEWSNALTGLGQMLRDKKTAAKAVYRGLLTQGECEEIYAVDKLHRRINDKLPDDATRRWIELEIPGAKPKDIKNINDEQDRLQIRQNVRKAWCWARRDGGSVIFINTGESEDALSKPLDVNRIQKLVNLLVISRWELFCSSTGVCKDISSPNFGNPDIYELRTTRQTKPGIKIHYTRLIRFDGEELPENLRRMNNYWHDSIFTGAYTALRNYGMSVSAAATLLSEFRQLYYYVKNLATNLGAGRKDNIRKRIEAQEMARSVLGSFLLDLDEEKIEANTITLAGFAETMNIVKESLMASSDMPHTILFNESPSGLGATGRSEQDAWYDHVHSQQEMYLPEKVDRIFEVMFSAKSGPTKGKVPEGWTYDFCPLSEPSGKEEAETEKLEAETAQIWIDNGILDSSEVRKKHFPDLKQLPEPERKEPEPNEPEEKQTGSNIQPKDTPPPAPGTGAPESS